MAVNPAVEGKTYPASPTYLVGREKVREFARAVLATNQIHFDVSAAKSAGYADVVAPPTFAMLLQNDSLEQLIADPDAGVDFSRVVHGDMRFSFSKPIVAGDELIATMTVSSVKSLAGNSLVTTDTVITDESGAHVVTAISTLVVRGEN